MLKENPLISVILSVYNSELTIDRCIKSILNQTFKDFEFIIVDDCSIDKSFLKIKNYQSIDKRIKIIKNLENIGLTKSLIKAINESNGKFIARIDADEYSKPSRLIKQYNYMLEKKLSLSGSCCRNIYKNAKRVTKWYYCEDRILLKKISYRAPFPHGTAMFTRKAYFETGGYDKKFITSQDLDLWNKIIKKGNVSMINENLIYRYIENESITNQKKFKQFLDSTLIRLKHSKVSRYPLCLLYSFFSLIISYTPTKVFLLIKKLSG